MNCSLIHFGSGALGLGLVVSEFSSLSNVDIHIVNRKSSDSQRKNEILKSRRHYYVRKPGFDCVVKFKSFIDSEDSENLNSIVSHDSVVFLTTALKEHGLDAMLPTICEVIHERNISSVQCPLVFIACENAITSSAVEIKVKEYLKGIHGDEYTLSQKILFLDCVVDKICNRPVVHAGNIISRTEEYCSWIISDKNFKKIDNEHHVQYIRDTLTSIKNITLVSDLDFYIRRKKWLVNSIHQLIAILSHSYKYLDVQKFVITDSGNHFLAGLREEINEIYLLNEPSAHKSDTSLFLDQVIVRLKESSFLVTAALSRLGKSEQLPAFFGDFKRKVGDPTSKYMQHTQMPLFWIPFTLLKVTKLIADNNYVA